MVFYNSGTYSLLLVFLFLWKILDCPDGGMGFAAEGVTVIWGRSFL